MKNKGTVRLMSYLVFHIFPSIDGKSRLYSVGMDFTSDLLLPLVYCLQGSSTRCLFVSFIFLSVMNEVDI